MKKSSSSVLIVDDHAVVAEGLQIFLENAGFQVIGRASSGRQAVEAVQEHAPLVVLLDIVMPDMDGLEALAAIKEVRPETIVIMVTASNSLDSMAQAVALGAAGYVLKETSLTGIPHVIRAAVAGHSIVDPALLRSALHAGPTVAPLSPGIRPGEAEPLTAQELRVLKLIAEGLDNESIASILVISRNTVKSHVSKLLKKLGVSDRTQAAIWAIRNGVVK